MEAPCAAKKSGNYRFLISSADEFIQCKRITGARVDVKAFVGHLRKSVSLTLKEIKSFVFLCEN